MPVAMRPNVPMLQGIIIMVLYCPDPEAKGALKSFLEYWGIAKFL